MTHTGPANPPQHPPAPTPRAAPRALRPAAVVLLAGAVRRSGLARTAGRSRLDLPLRQDLTVGDAWARRFAELRATPGRAGLPVILATNSTAPKSTAAEAWDSVRWAMDREEPRGSGGALRDLAETMDPDDRILVVSGHVLARGGWAAILDDPAAASCDLAIETDEGRAPTGTFLVRCGCLADLPARGFIDLKEQAMPQIAARYDVRVLPSADAPPIPILTLDGYLRAVRECHADGAPPVEDWRCSFALAEAGASVHPSARLHDAVVLAGARVEAGAVVVRSVIGPGAVVARGGSAIDELVSGPEGRP